jgi:hypothetical protein
MNLKLNSKSLQIISKRLGRRPFVKKSGANISLDCPFKFVLVLLKSERFGLIHC